MLPDLLPLDPTEPAVAPAMRMAPDPDLTLWRGHTIQVCLEPLLVYIDGRPLPLYSVGPERYRSWLLPRSEFRSPTLLAKAVVLEYFALSERTLLPADPTEELELLPPD